MKKSFVLNVNKEVIVLNWISFYQWGEKSIEDSFKNTLKYYSEMNNALESDIKEPQIKQFLKDYTIKLANEANTLNKFIARLCEQHICTSFKKLMKERELTFNTKNDLQNFISQIAYTIQDV